MYPALLDTHSIIRFVVIIASAFSIFLAFAGWFSTSKYTKIHKVLNLLTLISAHTQLLVGLVLYFISPNVMTQNMGAAMKNATLRYWTVEHISMMIIAIVLIPIGYSKSKKVEEAIRKHRIIATFYTIAAIIVIAAIAMSGRPILAMSR